MAILTILVWGGPLAILTISVWGGPLAILTILVWGGPLAILTISVWGHNRLTRFAKANTRRLPLSNPDNYTYKKLLGLGLTK